MNHGRDEGTLDGGVGTTELLSDGPEAEPVCSECLCAADVDGSQPFRTAETFATTSSSVHAGLGALTDELPLKLRDSGDDVEGETSSRGGGIDAIVQRQKVDPA